MPRSEGSDSAYRSQDRTCALTRSRSSLLTLARVNCVNRLACPYDKQPPESDAMLIGQLLLSILTAISVTGVALLSGWSLLAALVLYSLSGSLTLALLSVWTIVRADA